MRHTITALMCIAAIGSIAAAELSMLASGAVEGPLETLEKSYRQHGVMVRLQFDPSPMITKRLASGETPDVLIAQTSTVDQMIREGRALGDSRVAIGRIGIGVAVGRGGRKPDVSTVDALKVALRQADRVLLTQGAAGAYMDGKLRELGLMDEIAGKVTQMPTGESLTRRLGTGGNQIGFTMISELRYGARLGASYVGPLPAAMQRQTPYDAVVMSGSRAQDAARAFVKYITTPAARKLFTADGWEF